MNSKYSDEMINAFVDDELDSSDKESIKQAMAQDAELYASVNAVCALKKSLKQSYENLPGKYSSADSNLVAGPRVPWSQAVAAVLLLCVGLVSGWYGHSSIQNDPVSASIEGLQLSPVNMQQPNKIILHVSSSSGDKLEQALFKVEAIIEQYRHSQQSYAVEVIANSGGIDLLRQDVSPYADRIAELMASNDNVSFIACSNALEKLRLRGIEPRLIADTHTGTTAIEQIVKRLQQGWVYVKV